MTWPLWSGDACAYESAAGGPQHSPEDRREYSIGARDIRLRLAIGKPLERFLALVTCGLANIASPSDGTNVDDSGLFYHAPPVAVAIGPVGSSGLALEIKIGQLGHAYVINA